MKQIKTLRELQKVNIYIYKDIINFCNKNNLKVYLLGGSLIGAVRHKGFIPWDDDIDICMSREDYIRLLEISGGVISDKCSITDPETNSNYKGYIPLISYNESEVISDQYREKEIGKISVSLFVYDGTPSNKLGRSIYYLHMYLLRACHALSRADFNHVNTKLAKTFGPFLSPFFRSSSVYKYKNKILKLQKKYSYNKSRYVSANCDDKARKEVFKKERFEKCIQMEFEGIKSNAFSYYDEYLTKYYGNYMQLPPENARTEKHGFHAWVEDTFDFGV